MSQWGFFFHREHPFPPPHPHFPGLIAVVNQLLVAGTAGIGMFCEAYFLFAIGNIHLIWDVLYPSCFTGGGSDGCSEEVVIAATYVEVAGLIFGMLSFGVLANLLGRRWSSRTIAVLMLIGAILLVAASGTNLTGQFIMFNVGLFIFGTASGGEYPTAATSAAERASMGETKHFEHRGRLMVLTFAMQGWGNVVNTAVICFLLAVTSNVNCPISASSSKNGTCNEEGLNITWRTQYAIGIIVVLGMLFVRFFRLRESQMWEERQKQMKKMKDAQRKKERAARYATLRSRDYTSRLAGVALCWYLWDVAFYGNKLFQGTIIRATLGNNLTLMNVLTATLLNSAISLVGYYCAALLIDVVGRVRIQAFGFAVVSGIYLTCGFAYNSLTSSSEGITAFQALYYISSFFAQLGPNATTWLLPGELFPTDIRTEAHGVAASSGKLGALTASLLFSLGAAGKPVAAEFIFIVTGFTCFVGLLITIIFVPDTTNLTLKEVDRKWEARLLGEEYNGPAQCWENLSFFECWLFGKTRKDTVKAFESNDTDEDAIEQGRSDGDDRKVEEKEAEPPHSDISFASGDKQQSSNGLEMPPASMTQLNVS